MEHGQTRGLSHLFPHADALIRLSGGIMDSAAATAMSGGGSNAHHPIAVQATNDTSLVSKQSAVALGYLDDPWLKQFAVRCVP